MQIGGRLLLSLVPSDPVSLIKAAHPHSKRSFLPVSKASAFISPPRLIFSRFSASLDKSLETSWAPRPDGLTHEATGDG